MQIPPATSTAPASAGPLPLLDVATSASPSRSWPAPASADALPLLDVNAALNIAARGHARLAGGIPVL